MKAKDEMKLSVLRMAKAAFQLKEVDKMRKLDEQESIQLLQTLVKQRKESIDQFGKGGRQTSSTKSKRACHSRGVPAGRRIAGGNGCGCVKGYRRNGRELDQTNGRCGEGGQKRARGQDS